MISSNDLIKVLSKDKNFARLLANAKGSDVLSNIGFDSLDNMLISHLIEQEYNKKIDIIGMDSINNIVDKVNEGKNS